MENTIKVYIENANGELIVREGEAQKPLELKPPVKTKIEGVLDAPFKWLEKRVHLHDQLQANILFSNENKEITLTILESEAYTSGTIKGSLKAHPDKDLWKINQGFSFTNFQLAKLIKMNRAAFESHTVSMDLVATLTNFQAKISQDLEKSNNGKGDVKTLRAQTVESNLPDAFRINLGIFKGYPKKSIIVEVEVDPDTFNCALISPDFKELEDKLSDSEIQSVLDAIVKIAPDIAIIEI